MLYLNNKDALLAGFATLKAPHVTYGLHAGRLHVRVLRSFEKYKGDHLYTACCVFCDYSSAEFMSLDKAKDAGRNHVATCVGSK